MWDSLRLNRIAFLFAIVTACSGCGGNPAMTSCSLTVEVQVNPTTATANHASAPPANQVQFIGTAEPTAPYGCPVPQWVALDYATWSNPDPADIQISSAGNSTNGTAVCLAPTNGAATLTGTFTQFVSNPPVTKTVQLTCN
jgi:hypothetical protein